MLFLIRRSTYFRAVCALALVLLPLALGGGGDPLATVLTVCVTAVFCLVVPAGARLDKRWLAIFAGLAILPLLALLPGYFSGHAEWRAAVDGLGSPFPLITPQPKMLLRVLPLYYAGLAFAGWSLRAGWEPAERHFLGIALELGFAAVLVLALLFNCLRMPLPFWDPASGLGPFPSRNQSGLFFAIGFVWALPLASASRAQGRNFAAVLWLALGAAFFCAAFFNGSRAGVGFCVLGAVLYTGIAGFASRRTGMIALAGALLLGAVFLIALYNYDNAALSWLNPLLRRDGVIHSFRIKVHGDTWDLIRDFPMTGVGLGNYDAVFPFYRSRSVMDYRVLHAESDWLHFAAECGLAALVVLALGVLRLFVPAGREVFTRDRYGFTRASLVIMVIAAVHGFFDQSLHSAGIVFPVLLIASLSLRPEREVRVTPRVGWQGVVMGVALLALGFRSVQWISYSRLQGTVLDGYRLTEPLRMSLSAVEAALEYAPLSWNLHEMRARLLLDQGRNTEALSEFRTARLLEPYSLGLVLRESNAWIDAGKASQSMEAARQAVIRAAPDRQGAMYGEYLSKYSSSSQARKLWLDWSPSGKLEFTVVRIPFLSPGEARAALDAIVAGVRSDTALSNFAGRQLVVLEMQRGEGRLEAMQRAGFRFPDDVWIAAALDLVAQNHTEEACEIVIAELDPTDGKGSLPGVDVLERQYFAAPGDWHGALRLADVYLGAGSALSAERVINHLPGNAGTLPRVSFYKGWIAHIKGDNALAWVCFRKYIDEGHPGSP